jgi:hypothetical protein
MEPLWRSEQILNGPAIHFSRGTSLCWLVVLHMRCRTKNAVGCSRRQLLSYRVQLPRASYRVFWQAPHASYGPPRARRRGPPPRGGALRPAGSQQPASTARRPAQGRSTQPALQSVRYGAAATGTGPRNLPPPPACVVPKNSRVGGTLSTRGVPGCGASDVLSQR